MIPTLYIIAFTALSILAVANLIRSMVALSKSEPTNRSLSNRRSAKGKAFHPELIDANGNITQEPLLVMRSFTMDDARARLDAIYEASNNFEP
jgi:Protein of unknown function (DUF2973)